jgi:hypothetical protein
VGLDSVEILQPERKAVGFNFAAGIVLGKDGLPLGVGPVLLLAEADDEAGVDGEEGQGEAEEGEHGRKF